MRFFFANEHYKNLQIYFYRYIILRRWTYAGVASVVINTIPLTYDTQNTRKCLDFYASLSYAYIIEFPIYKRLLSYELFFSSEAIIN